jgi:uncharacterized repeat protein (TIGR01451 family)
MGTYTAQIQVRTGEYHFVAEDVETSGGDQDGLTICQATSDRKIDTGTRVYWDDVTKLIPPGTTTLPGGRACGLPAGHHTWGDFSATGFGNDQFIDTYVYGLANTATAVAVVTNQDFAGDIADLAITQHYRLQLVSEITLTLVARNNGPIAANGAVVSDTFHSRFTNVAWTCVSGGGATCTANGAGNIHDTLASFPPGGVVTYTVRLFLPHFNYWSNTAEVIPPVAVPDPYMPNNRAYLYLYEVWFPVVVLRSSP